ncbi:MAG: ABC transporter substrate-binding protein [Alphaproteobacteria bacterium]|nr:ABC transporter substrate-binding protein [Alphaproteobacteria bacterium]MBT4017403.1 ABC transporter substrate-binding protein [Alphaproteobacteria bacterium]MBT5159368.1 ABC transporter substrate-binding protein [Alphaproteobacteria bacterium]MBT5919457.1 ABC transporter substrate-binding protein [Alphaproteobacteria bacterium]MBT6384349.1 ABC transporter substrate-binding protein [Alphaproteobacteria bacterium]
MPGLCLALLSGAVEAEPRHGLSTFGDLKYPADFKHFDYVNPQAPKGGTVKLRDIGTFDNLNPFIIKGVKLRGMAAVAQSLPYDTLMVSAADEADAMYGLVAKSVDVDPDKQWVEFVLRPEARFHDGSPITTADLIYSFNTLKTEGIPGYRINLKDVEAVTASGPHKIRYRFRDGVVTRDLPAFVAGLPILSKAYYAAVPFNKTTLTPPLTSGPYRIGRIDQGRTLVYERVADYWAKDLPVNVGRFNFDKMQFDFYRDRTVSMQAFKSREYDFREDFYSKNWATGYKFPAVKNGWVIKESVPNLAPASRQYFVLNLRREKFQDIRVREAFALAFDFAWTNKNLFYGAYSRSLSLFQNTDMAARSLPNDAEKKLLKSIKGKIPTSIRTAVYQPPGEGSGLRKNLRRAKKRLSQGGWKIIDGKLTDKHGKVLEIEILTFSPSFERILAPIVKNLKRLGIQASMRIVDTAQYTYRMQTFDFDVTTAAFGTSATPGISERNFWGSASADQDGSVNYSGLSDPVIDELLKRITSAADRQSLTLAARTLDRVLLANHYIIPEWFNATHNLAYWDKFSRPKVKPKYVLGFMDTWWFDAAKAEALKDKMQKGDN